MKSGLISPCRVAGLGRYFLHFSTATGTLDLESGLFLEPKLLPKVMGIIIIHLSNLFPFKVNALVHSLCIIQFYFAPLC